MNIAKPNDKKIMNDNDFSYDPVTAIDEVKASGETAKIFSDISFEEAIELAFYGAKVIHPKTIQPLQAKKIPLRVKSFIEPNRKGTIISEVSKINPFLPFYIVKDNQILISISDPLLSFVVE